MDLALSPEQRELLDVTQRVLSDHAGPDRARQCRDAGRVDTELRSHLATVGLRELFVGTDTTLVDQVLCVEAAGRALAQVHLAGMFLGPKLDVDAWVVVPLSRATAPVRLPDGIEAAVLPDGGRARLHPVRAASTSRHGWGDAWGSLTLDGGGGPVTVRWDRLMAWYRLALVADGVGAAQGAMDLTISYLAERQQFGAPIASRQAVRHDLVELHGDLMAARLLLYEAAWRRATTGSVAMACTALMASARRLVPDLQRFNGAIGFSSEYDLHLFTGRLRAVVAELGPRDDMARTVFGEAQEGEVR